MPGVIVRQRLDVVAESSVVSGVHSGDQSAGPHGDVECGCESV